MGLRLKFENLSDADDTALLQHALRTISSTDEAIIDIHHAGTDMRFLTALLSVSAGQWLLTGSERMKQRPIGELVKALKQLGAQIDYTEKEGFPPLKIKGRSLGGGTLEIDGSQSSQFISALLLIAPNFKNGLSLHLKGEIVSQPYINMTVELLKHFGVETVFKENGIKVCHSKFKVQSSKFHVESDWSSASYWYSICALSPGSIIELSYLTTNSLQADAVLPGIFKHLGVNTQFTEQGLQISHTGKAVNEFDYDFTNCPDIAQTLAVTCFGLGVKATLTGLQTLKIKETNRINALKTELEQLGAVVEVTESSLEIGGAINQEQETRNKEPRIIHTYNDHRMAMSFAALACVYDRIMIDDESVVSKSYPSFWRDLKNAGFSVNLRA